MKEGFTLKSAPVGKEELDVIAQFARRELKGEEVYVFSVVLCDNEIDRDGERFSVPALQTLSELFVGKTGIFDHSMKGRDQTARIFSAKVDRVAGRKTSLAEDYHQLVARAYMPRLSKNAELIEEIELGIKKEVSVGCSVGKMSCSVCGADPRQGGCAHQKGRIYNENGKIMLCHVLLEEPQDAYEWSFVAVPAQPLAGVTKSFVTQKEEIGMEKILEQIRKHQAIALPSEASEFLDQHIQTLEKEAALGRMYRQTLSKDVVRLCALAEPKLHSEFVKALTEKMDVEELEVFKRHYESRAREVLPMVPQLIHSAKVRTGQKHSEFKI